MRARALYRLTMFCILCYTLCMKQSTGFRLTTEARALLDAMSKANGISHTAMLELLIREGAKKRGIRAGTQLHPAREPSASDSQ